MTDTDKGLSEEYECCGFSAEQRDLIDRIIVAARREGEAERKELRDIVREVAALEHQDGSRSFPSAQLCQRARQALEAS